MRVGIKEAAIYTGLSKYALYAGVKDGRLPAWKTANGKIIFDTELLDQAIRDGMMQNVQQFKDAAE